MANGLYVSKEHRCDGWPYYSDVMTDEENCKTLFHSQGRYARLCLCSSSDRSIQLM